MDVITSWASVACDGVVMVMHNSNVETLLDTVAVAGIANTAAIRNERGARWAIYTLCEVVATYHHCR